jgi:hypothetical protein
MWLFQKNKGIQAYTGVLAETPLFPKRDIAKEARDIALAFIALAAFLYLLIQHFGPAACPT